MRSESDKATGRSGVTLTMDSQEKDLLAVVLGQPSKHFNYKTNSILECCHFCYAESIVKFSLHFMSTQTAVIESRGGHNNDR